ncbi:MAG: hypothetical protein LBF16_15440 [Pseudomonadales bacterium]|jgi:hypothetical protein|nr:hypothetical protein [Pseudomonadales bacterium]
MWPDDWFEGFGGDIVQVYGHYEPPSPVRGGGSVSSYSYPEKTTWEYTVYNGGEYYQETARYFSEAGVEVDKENIAYTDNHNGTTTITITQEKNEVPPQFPVNLRVEGGQLALDPSWDWNIDWSFLNGGGGINVPAPDPGGDDASSDGNKAEELAFTPASNEESGKDSEVEVPVPGSGSDDERSDDNESNAQVFDPASGSKGSNNKDVSGIDSPQEPEGRTTNVEDDDDTALAQTDATAQKNQEKPSSSTERDSLGIVGALARVNSGLASVSSASEVVAGKTTIGTNFTLYESGWHGNQYVKTISVTGVARAVGNATVLIGIGLDAMQVANKEISPVKMGVNTTVGIYGAVVGTVAAPAVITYFGLEATYPGGVLQAMEDYGEISLRMQATDPLWNKTP